MILFSNPSAIEPPSVEESENFKKYKKTLESICNELLPELKSNLSTGYSIGQDKWKKSLPTFNIWRNKNKYKRIRLYKT